MLIRPLIANGITLNGFKFMCIQATPEEVIGRKGVSLLNSSSAVFVSSHSSGRSCGENKRIWNAK